MNQNQKNINDDSLQKTDAQKREERIDQLAEEELDMIAGMLYFEYKAEQRNKIAKSCFISAIVVAAVALGMFAFDASLVAILVVGGLSVVVEGTAIGFAIAAKVADVYADLANESLCEINDDKIKLVEEGEREYVEENYGSQNTSSKTVQHSTQKSTAKQNLEAENEDEPQK